MEQIVVVKPQSGKPTLNLETVLFLDKGQRVLGKIFDVFGSVSEPYYCIRFNNSEHIKQHEIETGLLVYYCPDTEYTLLVFLHELAKLVSSQILNFLHGCNIFVIYLSFFFYRIRGCDDVGDDEPPEFSDDEEEQAYYQKLNQKNSSADNTANSTANNTANNTANSSTSNNSIPNKRQRTSGKDFFY